MCCHDLAKDTNLKSHMNVICIYRLGFVPVALSATE